MKAKEICFEEHPYTAEIRDVWNVETVPSFIVMRRDADEEMGRVVGLMPETQSPVEDYVAKAKTLKIGAPTPQIVEVARQPPTEAEPCSPETQDEAESLITVEDFDIPALREDAENPEEKIGILRATSVAETFPKRRVQTAPREVEQNGVWRRDRNELATSFLDFPLRDRRQKARPQEPEIFPFRSRFRRQRR